LRKRTRDRVRFRNEAEAVARLEHPNLVRIYEIGEQDGRPYFSMEYVPGGSLAHVLRSTPLPPGKAAALAQTLARAAHAVHERAVVHRDLSPSNVLLGADGEPKIVDFGLAKLVVGGGDQTESGDILVLQRHVRQLSMAQVIIFQELKSFLRISIRTWLMDQNPCETSHFLAIGVLTQR